MPSQRQRSRKACQPCRQRKRKCDGHDPCATCVRYEYDCYFAANDKAETGPHDDAHAIPSSAKQPESPISSPHAPPSIARKHTTSLSGPPGILDPYKTRFVSTSSAIAFPKILGIELNSTNAPRLHSFAWNLGVRSEPRVEKVDLTSFLTFTEFQRLSDVYFKYIHPVFDFIDRDILEERAQSRWAKNPKERDVEPIICGVAALGSLFSVGSQQTSHSHETELVEIAKDVLERTSTILGATIDHVTAWILRTIYLRATTRPHASWISSCTTMHIIEATGLHQEVSHIAIVSPAPPHFSVAQLDIRRRLFWIAWSLNTLISYEYGRSRADLRGMSVELPTGADPDEHSPSASDSSLFPIIALAYNLPAEDLNPLDIDAHTALYESLASLHALETRSDEMTLLKADLVFCIYRRLRTTAVSKSASSPPQIPGDALSTIINIGMQALPASLRLAAAHIPWWMGISVPFALLCVLLAIDSRESLSHVAESMRALEEVGTQWNTHMVREAVASAGLLVRLSRRRKEEELKALEDGMPRDVGSGGGPRDGILPSDSTAIRGLQPLDADASANRPVAGDQAGIIHTNGSAILGSVQIPGIAMPASLNWSAGLVDVSLPDNLNIDWDEFFSTSEWPIG